MLGSILRSPYVGKLPYTVPLKWADGFRENPYAQPGCMERLRLRRLDHSRVDEPES